MPIFFSVKISIWIFQNYYNGSSTDNDDRKENINQDPETNTQEDIAIKGKAHSGGDNRMDPGASE